jgi:DNA-binding MarR family transcriptional regulator
MYDLNSRTSEPTIGYYVKVIHHVLEKQMNTFLKKLDLTKTQMDVLHYLARNSAAGKAVKQKDLETYFHISNPSVSVMVDRLEYKGLLLRIKDDTDRRIRYLEPTEKAYSLMEEMHQAAVQVESEMLKGISESDVDSTRSTLKQIMNNMLESEGGSKC